ncbi:MAG: DUF3386 family protein [Gammaproteobacteria bacterium]
MQNYHPLTLAPYWAAALTLCMVIAATPAGAKEPPADPEAYRLLNRAVQARAVWDEAFPGFTADIRLNYQGHVQRGALRVLADGTIKLNGLDDQHSEARAWAYEWLGEMVFHRMGAQSSPEQYREIRFAGSKSDPLGPMLVTGDDFNSSFRVDGKVIRQVNRDLASPGARHEGPQRVRINVLATATTPEGGVLPVQYVINYLDEDGQLTGVDAVSSRFVRVGDYHVPQWRRVITTGDNAITTGELTLSNHRLIEASETASR